MNYTYMVKCADGTLYTGWTNCVEKRLKAHNEGKAGAKYTRAKRPVELVYYEGYATKEEAMRREYAIKQLTRKEKLKDFKGKAEFDLEVGHPSERVLAVCKDKKCSAIVIGSRGLSGIAEFFLGSVSSKVSQYADVPVLIVK